MRRRNSFIIATIAILAMAFVIGNLVLLNAMPKPKRLDQPVQVDYGVGDPQFQRTMSVLLQNPITSGNSIALLEDGEAIYASMLDAIAEAEHSVTFETYEFWGKEAAGAFATALSVAAERGVAVHALLDYIGSTEANVNIYDETFARDIRHLQRVALQLERAADTLECIVIVPPATPWARRQRPATPP